MKISQRRQQGFTIVELLIVIVVIAILAAIVIVAYNGVQSRANNTATIASVSAYAKAMQMYATQNGTYPVATNYPCLGPSGTTCANVSGVTAACFNTGATSYSASYDSAVRTIATSIPAPSTQRISCGGTNYAGAFYESSADGKTANINYFLSATTDCGSPGGLSLSGSGTGGSGIMCVGSLPALQ